MHRSDYLFHFGLNVLLSGSRERRKSVAAEVWLLQRNIPALDKVEGPVVVRRSIAQFTRYIFAFQ